MPELWDLYTGKREPTGEFHRRGDELPQDRFHLAVHVWIRNSSRGEYLISQRSASRPVFPLMWECAGGSVLKGENSLQGAVREVKEEVGIDLSASPGNCILTRKRGTVGGEKFNDITDIWLFEYDGKVDCKQATTDEVAQCRWLSFRQIQELYEKQQFVHTLAYFFEIFHA